MTVRAAIFKSAGFFELICDASYSYFNSKHENDNYRENRCARQSILSSALAMESFANCLIYSLGLPKEKYVRLERLPTFRKINEFRKYNGSRRIDSTNNEIQKAIELIQIRNDFVHVKTGNIESEIEPSKLRSVDIPRWDFTIQPDIHPLISIYKEPLSWQSGDALKAISTAADFFRIVTTDLGEDTRLSVNKSLASAIEVESLSVPIPFPYYELELSRLADEGIDLFFLSYS